MQCKCQTPCETVCVQVRIHMLAFDNFTSRDFKELLDIIAKEKDVESESFGCD